MTVIRSALWGVVAAGVMSTAAWAQGSDAVRVDGGWVRATVAGQKGTGAFMTLTAPQGATLVGVSSPAAGVAEVHEMKMDGGVMKMRAITSLNLPAGKAVELKPGGYHLMLMDLKAPLAKETMVPVTLKFKDARGAEVTQPLTLPVGTEAPGGKKAAQGHEHGHAHDHGHAKH